MEHELKDIVFYVQKHITPSTVVITSLLVHDKPLEAPGSVKRVYSEILIAGDYNINLLNPDVRQAFNDFFTSCNPIAISLESLYPLD